MYSNSVLALYLLPFKKLLLILEVKMISAAYIDLDSE